MDDDQYKDLKGEIERLEALIAKVDTRVKNLEAGIRVVEVPVVGKAQLPPLPKLHSEPDPGEKAPDVQCKEAKDA
jgi:hypothetical protein